MKIATLFIKKCKSFYSNGKYKNSSDMEDKIFDIVTDLIRDDITKDEAIDKLLILYNVKVCISTKAPSF